MIAPGTVTSSRVLTLSPRSDNHGFVISPPTFNPRFTDKSPIALTANTSPTTVSPKSIANLVLSVFVKFGENASLAQLRELYAVPIAIEVF